MKKKESDEFSFFFLYKFFYEKKLKSKSFSSLNPYAFSFITSILLLMPFAIVPLVAILYAYMTNKQTKR